MATKYIVNNVTGQTINGESILPKYKVYTALLTQSGGDDAQFIISGAVTSGVTYYIDNAGISSDFSNVGGPPIGNGGAFFVATNSDVPNNWDGASLQYNTGAPTVTVLENTIGNVWFTYSQVGQYLLNFSETFSIDKIYSQGNYICEDGANFIVTSLSVSPPNQILISTTRPIDISNDDDILNKTPIEIRVYN